MNNEYSKFIMNILHVDGAWIDPATAAAAAIAHHPGLSAVPYHPDYGDGR